MSTDRSIRAISFDGDMTLWDFMKVMRHSLSIALSELRGRIPGSASAELTIDRLIEIRNLVAAELKGEIINLEEIRFHAFKRTVESLGRSDDELAAELNDLYLKHRFEDIELYPDVIPTLDTLGRAFCIGLLFDLWLWYHPRAFTGFIIKFIAVKKSRHLIFPATSSDCPFSVR